MVVALLRWIQRTPEPVLAAIVIHAIGRSLDPGALRQYFAWRRDRLVVLAAMAAVLVLGVLDGLLAGIAASLLLMMRELSVPRVARLGRLGHSHDYIDLDRHPEAHPVPGVLIARPDAPLFFANAERILATIGARIRADASLRAVVLSLEESPDLDSTAIEALREFAQTLQRHGLSLILARVKDHVRDVLTRVQVPELPPSCYPAWSVDDAVREATHVGAQSRRA
jgi:MFS superfamily sulfate permease-like transporter